jgi:hypothetical protein
MLIKKEMKKLGLKFIFIVTLVHFLKDITQDILRIPTILDRLGNIQEDLTHLPSFLANIIIVTGYLSFLGEIAILVLTPLILKNNFRNKTYNMVFLSIVIVLLIYFITATFLDPKVIYFLNNAHKN